MKALKAQVRGGRLVLDIPTKLPEGAVIELVVVDLDDDDLDDNEQAALHSALQKGWASVRERRTRPAENMNGVSPR